MYKVFLVDDEKKNYKLFEKLVDWEGKGFEIIGTAADGVEALKKYEELQPDLIFMDIQLPMMDGIECIRWIREEDKAVQIVIVSAYGEFNYAQKAIRYGVQDFLLKPVSRVMLNQIVDRVKEHLDNREKEEAENCLQNEYDSILREWLVQKEENAVKNFPIPEENRLMRILVTSTNQNIREDSVHEIIRNGQEFRKIRGLVCIKNSIYFLIQKDSEKTVMHLLDEMKKKGYLVEAYLWSEHAPEYEKSRFWKTEGDIDNYGFYEEDSEIFSIIRFPYSNSDISSAGRESVIKNALIHNDKELLVDYVRQIFDFAKKHRVQPGKLKEFTMDFLLHLKFALNKYDEKNTKTVLRNIRLENIYQIYKAEELQIFLLDKIEEVYVFLKSYFDENRSEGMIVKARIIAELHFCDKDFSIQKVVDEIGISKNYFISQYKSQLGIGYWEYVTQLRMENAKNLLLMTNDSISLIAEKTGYDSEYYFSRKFKEYYGVSPKGYRKNNSI